eukprot:TRINITY_DN395_c0_g1_i2.p1 TRINITY_DN395_c0_g1~~TRINITY_DN395_c0_g1_i2.p1  ORF type:complete len:263 (+),score=34.38 TRINITY_DN395_c0_g1_i2:41-829(+)
MTSALLMRSHLRLSTLARLSRHKSTKIEKMSAVVDVNVWSDIACPWCLVGKKRLDKAIEQFDGQVRVHWRAFELNPAAERESPPNVDYVGKLAAKYHVSDAQAKGFIDRMVEAGREDGVNMDFSKIRPGNTFDAHRMIHYADEKGKQDEMKEFLLRGYLERGESIGSHEFLQRAGEAVGLDAKEVEDLLSSKQCADEVLADEAEARRNRVSGVPYFVIGGIPLSGAQPSDTILHALNKAKAVVVAEAQSEAKGSFCTVDGCT